MLRRCLCRLAPTFTPIYMPSLSPSMESGRITEWKRKVGDSMREGDTWCMVETDKAVVEFTNTMETGYVAALYAKPGEKVTVGRTIALLVEDEADVAKASEYVIADAAAPAAPAAAAAAPAAAVATEVAAPPPSAAATKAAVRRFSDDLTETINASGPSVIRIARGLTDTSVLESVAPTGRGGRFVKQDLAHLPNFAYESSTTAAAATAAASNTTATTTNAAPSAPAAEKKQPAAASSSSPSLSFLIKGTPVVNFAVSDTLLIRKFADQAKKVTSSAAAKK